jgi:hypothetical protein
LVWHETISALHAKGAKAAKESTQNETLSPTQVSPEGSEPVDHGLRPRLVGILESQNTL